MNRPSEYVRDAPRRPVRCDSCQPASVVSSIHNLMRMVQIAPQMLGRGTGASTAPLAAS